MVTITKYPEPLSSMYEQVFLANHGFGILDRFSHGRNKWVFDYNSISPERGTHIND